jgi:hypothetical protein
MRIFSPIGKSLLCLTLLGLAGSAPAEEWVFAGARYQAMGGASVAFADDSLAAYSNPANLAFRKGWDVQLPATLNANIENRMLQDISGLLVRAENLSAQFDQIEQGTGSLTGADAQNVVDWLLDFRQLGKNGQSIHAGVNVGLLGRYNGFGFSATSTTTATGYPNVDQGSLALFVGSANPLTSLVGALPPATAQDTALVAEILALSAAPDWNAGNINKLVSIIEQSGHDTNDPATRQFILRLAEQTANGSAGNSLAASNTGTLLGGISVQEFGISYAHTLPLPFFAPLDEKISVGGTLKYMLGITWVRFVRYDEVTSGTALANELASLKDHVTSHNVGLDIGASYRPFEWLRFGMQARNINSPAFDARGVGEIELDAQVRMGMAVLPIRHLTLALDFDATENKIVTIPGFRSRLVSVGAEYAIPLGRHFDLALRLGTYGNTAAEDSNWALSGGLGLRMGSFYLDLSGAGSLNKEAVQTDTNSYTSLPTRLGMGVNLKWERSI